MNNADNQYLNLLRDVLSKGVKKSDRTGVGTISMFGYQMRFNMREGFPLLTTKKLYTKAIVHELLWFLQGGDNIKYLVDNGVSIWNEWPWQAYCKERSKLLQEQAMLNERIKNPDMVTDDPAATFSNLAIMQERLSYVNERLSVTPHMELSDFAARVKADEQFAREWGQLGPVYGKQWVNWFGLDVHGCEVTVNQIDNILKDLATNPDSRRIMVSAWNVPQVPDTLLPPCHWAFQLWTRELEFNERLNYIKDSSYDKMVVAYCESPGDTDLENILRDVMEKENTPKRAVSLMFQMRSVDCFLGMPFDIASYGILLEMIAQVSGMVADELIVTSGDTHIYLNHLDQVNEQLTRTPFELPTIKLNPDVKSIYDFKYEDVQFLNYKAHPSIKADVAI